MPTEFIYERDPKTGSILNTYSKGRFLGKGGFAKCYVVVDCATKIEYAAKVINKDTLQKPKTRQKLKSEIKIHRSVNHNNLVAFKKYFEDEDNVYIILELCREGCLMDLSKKKGRFTEEETAYLVRQIVIGVRHLHGLGIIHRDLKLGNIMLSSKMDVKIGDFGLAARLYYPGEKRKTLCGTPNYIAPEILSSGHQHSYEADVWTIGIIVYAMLFGKPPFQTKDVHQTYGKIKKCSFSFPSTIPASREAKDLINNILRLSPSERPTVDELLDHPFFVKAGVSPPSSLLPHSGGGGQVTYKQLDKPKSRRTPLGVIDHNVDKQTGKKERIPLGILDGRNELNRIHYDNGIGGYRRELKPRLGGGLRSSSHRIVNMKNVAAKYEDKQPQQLLHNEKYAPIPSRQLSPPMRRSASASGDRRGVRASASVERPASTSPSYHVTPPGLLPTHRFEKAPQFTAPSNYITHYTDYSNKYGLAYRLNCGLIGVHFNDNTKMLLNPTTGAITYVARVKTGPGAGADNVVEYSLDDFPETLNKKVTLIKYFDNYIAKAVRQGGVTKEGQQAVISCNNFTAGNSPTSETSSNKSNSSNDVYLRKWIRTDDALFFRLSNRLVQVCFFDGTEIILSPEGSRQVTYTDKSGQRDMFSLATMPVVNADANERIQYTRDIIGKLINVHANPMN
eukprot:TRINITY_DN18534_c0_g1_i1.p1 TRINITY_DN18534_c0_g1~~TRINITY_DN18534_c0_g1_i1.p1  ORF type:complete len:677 (+),score=127.73 TRINITY_DN18534_c0_g1_i1:43-2073(+)